MTKLFLPQFAKMYILLIKLDFMSGMSTNMPQQKQWATAFTDLLSLVTEQTDGNVQQMNFKFVIRTLLTLDEEIVERAEQRSVLDLELANKIKDHLREHAK